jgi:hypothetical protein
MYAVVASPLCWNLFPFHSLYFAISSLSTTTMDSRCPRKWTRKEDSVLRSEVGVYQSKSHLGLSDMQWLRSPKILHPRFHGRRYQLNCRAGTTKIVENGGIKWPMRIGKARGLRRKIKVYSKPSVHMGPGKAMSALGIKRPNCSCILGGIKSASMSVPAMRIVRVSRTHNSSFIFLGGKSNEWIQNRMRQALAALPRSQYRPKPMDRPGRRSPTECGLGTGSGLETGRLDQVPISVAD